MSKCLLLILCLLLTGGVYSQVLPKEGSLLNYRLVGFSCQGGTHSGSSEIQIASGTCFTKEDFRRNIVKTVPCKGRRTVTDVPLFGSSYTWRTATTKDRITTFSELHHFSTAVSPKADTGKARLRIIKQATKYKDAYVYLDGNAVLYDINGNPVWFLPSGFSYSDQRIYDLKLSGEGTITFLTDNDAYEIAYNGDILWKTPERVVVNGQTPEHYHHEFTRLRSGHYMVLGTELVDPSSLLLKNNPVVTKSDDGKPLNRKLPFGTVIEYNQQGGVEWQWKSSEYFRRSDLVETKASDFADPMAALDIHENAFYFDEKERVIYISFKNISRIVKIKYPEGNVLNEYGERYKDNAPIAGNGLFTHQHACKRSAAGCLFLFNNNGGNPGGLPKIKRLAEPLNNKESLKKIWEYTCTVEPGAPNEFPSGGNVMDLPDQDIFVCMGSKYSKVFIVDTGKNLLWSALPEKWNVDEKKWEPYAQYRASIIYDPAQIERLIFNAGPRRNSTVKIANK